MTFYARGFIQLVLNASASGNSELCALGGRYVFDFVGTIGGATITLRRLGPTSSAVWIDVETVTGNMSKVIECAPGFYMLDVSGGTPSGLYATLTLIEP